MALAKRKARPEPLFVAAKQLTPSAGHPFNQKLNQLLDEDRVDAPLQENSDANIGTTRVRGMMRASVRQPDGVSATIELTGTSMRTVQSLSSV